MMIQFGTWQTVSNAFGSKSIPFFKQSQGKNYITVGRMLGTQGRKGLIVSKKELHYMAVKILAGQKQKNGEIWTSQKGSAKLEWQQFKAQVEWKNALMTIETCSESGTVRELTEFLTLDLHIVASGINWDVKSATVI